MMFRFLERKEVGQRIPARRGRTNVLVILVHLLGVAKVEDRTEVHRKLSLKLCPLGMVPVNTIALMTTMIIHRFRRREIVRLFSWIF